MTLRRFLGRTMPVVGVFAATALAPMGAQAADTPASTTQAAPASVLNLSVAADARSNRQPRSVVLSCEPAGGTHPKAEQACAELDRANGRFGSLRSGNENAMCPLVYRPVTVTATGTWRGKPVEHKQTYSNACTLRAYTGAVFDF